MRHRALVRLVALCPGCDSWFRVDPASTATSCRPCSAAVYAAIIRPAYRRSVLSYR